MRQSRVSRRRLLQLLGAGATASALPGLLPKSLLSRARAADAPPKRILFFYTNHGSHRPAWLPVGVGGAAASETAYDFGELHQPLLSYKQDILLIDGLDMLSSDVQTGPATNAHIRGHCHSMVAKEMADANLAGGISIDQHIAQALNTNGVLTPLRSLEIGVDPNQESRICFSGPSQQLPIEASPNNAFKRLFPNGAAGSGMSMPMMDNRAAQQKTVLDFIANEFGVLGPKVDKDARMRLEAHADLIRDLEARLSVTTQRTCTAPTLSASVSKSDYTAWYQNNADAFMRLIQAAFACDLTRVVTFALEAIPDGLSGYTGTFGTSDMHDLIHKAAPTSADALAKNPAAVAVVKQFHTEYAKQFKKMLDLLAAIPEADGTTALHNTIVLWCGEIAEGNHDLHKLPWLIAGQGGGTVRTGRYLQVPRTPKSRGHNDLFVALANAMGSPITTFGNPSICQGAMPGLS